MSLTWKDIATTVLAAGTVVLAYAKYAGWSSWLTGPRLGFVVLGLLGISMCIMSSPSVGATPAWTAVLSALGFLAFALIVVGVITGSAPLFYVLTADILALWLLSTVRHLVVAA